MTWTKETPIEKPSMHCLNCAIKGTVLDLETLLAVGFGDVTVTKNGNFIWSGDDPEKTVAEIEAMAKQDPDHDWRIFFFAPLYDKEYQRQADDHWVLIKQGQGFA